MSSRGNEFTQNRLDVTDLASNAGAALDRGLSSVFADKAQEQNFEDHQMEIALNQGQLSLGQINRIINDTRVTSDIRDEQAAKSRDSTNTMLFIALLDQLERDLAEAIQGHRDYFRDKYGDDYATVLGRPILGDDMPDRLPGESDEDYNKRVEDALFNEICHPDGSLKDEYKDHPDADRLTQWGKDRVASDRVKTLNASSSPEEVREVLKGTSIEEKLAARANTAGTDSEADNEIKAALDEQKSEVFNAPAETTENGFG
ncbi:MAG: hypothetical protein AAFR51_03975 [Pseudomonadota bacterium]